MQDLVASSGEGSHCNQLNTPHLQLPVQQNSKSSDWSVLCGNMVDMVTSTKGHSAVKHSDDVIRNCQCFNLNPEILHIGPF